jgi:hypothetical protein
MVPATFVGQKQSFPRSSINRQKWQSFEPPEVNQKTDKCLPIRTSFSTRVRYRERFQKGFVMSSAQKTASNLNVRIAFLDQRERAE